MNEQFKPTHKIVFQEGGIFSFRIGILVQKIFENDNYYKDSFGNRKYVPPEFVETI